MPIEEATLQRSGDTDMADGDGAVYYNTVYDRWTARAEGLQRTTPSAAAKWLERTVREESTAVRQVLTDGMRRRTR